MIVRGESLVDELLGRVQLAQNPAVEFRALRVGAERLAGRKGRVIEHASRSAHGVEIEFLFRREPVDALIHFKE